MIEYQYWTHKRSGETYAVQIVYGQVLGVCGPLYHEDYREDMSEFEYDKDDVLWVWNNKDDFRLEEKA